MVPSSRRAPFLHSHPKTARVSGRGSSLRAKSCQIITDSPPRLLVRVRGCQRAWILLSRSDTPTESPILVGHPRSQTILYHDRRSPTVGLSRGGKPRLQENHFRSGCDEIPPECADRFRHNGFTRCCHLVRPPAADCTALAWRGGNTKDGGLNGRYSIKIL